MIRFKRERRFKWTKRNSFIGSCFCCSGISWQVAHIIWINPPRQISPIRVTLLNATLESIRVRSSFLFMLGRTDWPGMGHPLLASYHCLRISPSFKGLRPWWERSCFVSLKSTTGSLIFIWTMNIFKWIGEKNMSIKKLKKEVRSFLKEFHELREKYGKVSWDEWIEPNGQLDCFPISFFLYGNTTY